MWLIGAMSVSCKALLVTSLTHVSGTIASVQTFTFLTMTLLLKSVFCIHYIYISCMDVFVSIPR